MQKDLVAPKPLPGASLTQLQNYQPVLMRHLKLDQLFKRLLPSTTNLKNGWILHASRTDNLQDNRTLAVLTVMDNVVINDNLKTAAFMTLCPTGIAMNNALFTESPTSTHAECMSIECNPMGNGTARICLFTFPRTVEWFDMIERCLRGE